MARGGASTRGATRGTSDAAAMGAARVRALQAELTAALSEMRRAAGRFPCLLRRPAAAAPVRRRRITVAAGAAARVTAVTGCGGIAGRPRRAAGGFPCLLRRPAAAAPVRRRRITVAAGAAARVTALPAVAAPSLGGAAEGRCRGPLSYDGDCTLQLISHVCSCHEFNMGGVRESAWSPLRSGCGRGALLIEQDSMTVC